MTLILGIETSCDETAAAVIEDGHIMRSNVVASQIDLHRQYGGVFPEIASRQHLIAIVPTIEQAMRDAGTRWEHLDALAVTYGPGLSGSLLVGVNAAKGLAYGRGLPLVGVNHIEAHVATNWLDVARQDVAPIEFPILCLIVSGGHTELALMRDYGEYQQLGSTVDDAAGEVFDKVARLLDLGYPGGPAIQCAADAGHAGAFQFPKARVDGAYDFSFSGLKTAVLRAVQRYQPGLARPADKLPSVDGASPAGRPSAQETDQLRNLPAEVAVNLAASFQLAVVDALVEKTCRAAQEHQVNGVLMAGGVAANRLLRERARTALPVPLMMPPVQLATDNAAGVGVAGYWALKRGHVSGWDLDVAPRLKLGE